MDLVRQQLLLLFLLLVFYCAPPLIVLVWAIASIAENASSKIEGGVLLPMLIDVSRNPGIYTNIIHQMIMPVVAALTAANYRSLALRGWLAWLFVLPLITIFVCIINALIMNTASTLDLQTKGLISQFFVGMASNLAIYVMLFVGLKMADTNTPAVVTDRGGRRNE